ncbi:MAG: hypothetical protein WBY53_10345 [Acidobacteriaceae bacterium]
MKTIINNDRLSQWFLGTLLAWIIWSLLLFIPIFHLGVGFPISKIIISASIGCVMQFIFTPSLFSARATPQNPTGKIVRRSITVIVWLTLTALLFSYYLQRSWPRSSDEQTFRMCLFGTIIVVGMVALIGVCIVSRQKPG